MEGRRIRKHYRYLIGHRRGLCLGRRPKVPDAPTDWRRPYMTLDKTALAIIYLGLLFGAPVVLAMAAVKLTWS